MKYIKYPSTLVIKVDARTRQAVENAAESGRVPLSEIARELLSEGIKARGLAF